MWKPHLWVAVALVLSACTASSTDPSSTLASTTTASATTPTTTSAAPTTLPATADAPDLILHNAQVLTVDDSFSIAEAVAVTGDRISAVGSSDMLVAMAGPETILVDVDGRTISPGFVEPHTHLMQHIAPDLDQMRAGQQTLLSWGVTTAGMPSVLPDQLGAFEALHEAGEIVLRSHLYVVYNSVCGERDLGDFYLQNDFVRDISTRLAVAGVKVFADGGVCGSMALTSDYLDTTPQHLKDRGFTGRGTLFVTADEVASVVGEVDAAGGQTIIHAQGDSAIATALEGLRMVGDTVTTHQIHHNSLVSIVEPDLLTTYGELGLTPVVFTMPWGGAACDSATADVWRSILPEDAFGVLGDNTALLDANPGIRLSWHGDGPSLTGSPLEQMFTLVDGGYALGGEICHPEAWAGKPTVSIEDGFRMMTINAAAAMGFEESIGSIEVGKLADLAILASDPMTDDHESGLAMNRPLVSIIGGTVEHCLGDLCAAIAGEVHDGDVEIKACSPLTTDGLIGWWPAEDATDVVGGNDGRLIDGAAIGRGYVGDAFGFNDGAVVLGGTVDLSGGFTVDAWVRFNESGFDGVQSVFNNHQVFLRKNDSSEGSGFGLFLNLDDGSVEPRAHSETQLQPGVWTHVAGTWDGSELRIYVDGRLDQAVPRQGSMIGTTVDAQIGRGEQDGLLTNPFDGSIDEFEIYERALSPAEIMAIFEAGNGGRCADHAS